MSEELERGRDFKLERYKYILQQLNTLNENSHRYLILYQTLATAIIGAATAIFISWKQLNIDANMARLGIRGMLGLFIIMTVFVILLLISGILSWIDYRKEEVKLLDIEVSPGFRKRPNVRNVWRWHETYIILFLVLVVISVCLFVENRIVPLVQ